MKKQMFVDKLAKRVFESAEVQKSWQAHMQAFGPILEPAFADNYRVRTELTAALNYISNRELKEGIQKLQSIQKSCITDDDHAAWLFFMGLCLDMANKKEDMLVYYQEAGKYGHKFYLPYLKIAKAAHNDAVFDVAESNYRKAIQCLLEDKQDEQKKVILGSVYTNYASCLTMMHRYKAAEEALENSADILPEQKGRAAAEAILAAAKGEAEKAQHFTEILVTQLPAFHKTTKKMVDSILEKKHPQFNRVEIKEGRINAFWNWFVSNEGTLLQKLEIEEYDTVVQMLQPELRDVFPFMERDLEVGIKPKEAYFQITFADYYMVSLEYGYKELIEAVPESLSTHWRFDTAR